MNVKQLRDTIQAQPFRPFSLILANGERLRVRHPDWIFLVPEGRTVMWIDQGERFKLLDAGLLLGVEVDDPLPAGTPTPEPNGGD